MTARSRLGSVDKAPLRQRRHLAFSASLRPSLRACASSSASHPRRIFHNSVHKEGAGLERTHKNSDSLSRNITSGKFGTFWISTYSPEHVWTPIPLTSGAPFLLTIVHPFEGTAQRSLVVPAFSGNPVTPAGCVRRVDAGAAAGGTVAGGRRCRRGPVGCRFRGLATGGTVRRCGR